MRIYSAGKYNIYPYRGVSSLTFNGNLAEKSLDLSVSTSRGDGRHSSSSVPAKFQEIADVLQRKSDGSARIEYNPGTNRYEVVQNIVSGKDIQEIRTVLNDSAWQENLTNSETVVKAGKDFKRTFSFKRFVIDILSGNIFNSNAVKAYRAAKRNLESQIIPEDYIQSQTTTYTNGKVVEGAYVEGKLKTLTGIEAGMSAPVDLTVITGKSKNVLNYPVDFSFKSLDKMPPAGKEFALSLIHNKAELMVKLGIDNDTYNLLAQTAIGIAKQETNFGEKSARQIVKDIARIKNDIAAYMQLILGMENSGNTFSQGITQLKFTIHMKDPWVNKKMKALGITNELQLKDPKKSAIATMVVLQKMNLEARTEAVKKGVIAAQGISVSLPGYYLDSNGIARKADKAHPAAPWKNNITRQDILCAYWNGGTRRAVANGTIKPAVWSYSNNVRKYTQLFELIEDKVSRSLAEEMFKLVKTCRG